MLFKEWTNLKQAKEGKKKIEKNLAPLNDKISKIRVERIKAGQNLNNYRVVISIFNIYFTWEIRNQIFEITGTYPVRIKGV